MTHRIAFVVLLSVVLGGCFAATPPSPSREEADAIKALTGMQKRMFDGVKPQSANLDVNDGQPAAMAGREDLLGATSRPPRCVPLPGDPVQRIAEAAKSTNIVIINENHARPRHRAFIGEVLKALRAEGYSIYAAETFTSSPDYDNKHAGVWSTDGYYTNEPMFGRTVRTAKSLGYRLLAYEQNDANGSYPEGKSEREQIAFREQAQTDNLMTAIFRDHPDAKVIIHVGFSHAMEEPIPLQGQPMPWMAARLKAATGRDPLTISETKCASPNDSIVAATDMTDLAADAPREPVDLLIGYPSPTTFTHGRPDWRRALGDVETPTPKKFLGRTKAVIVEARPAGASLAIVPTDRILERPGESLPLLLPPGHYRIDGFTIAGRIAGDPVNVTVR
jgi:hypothetical protein